MLLFFFAIYKTDLEEQEKAYEQKNQELDRLVKAIIDKTAAYEKLESQYFCDMAEAKKTGEIIDKRM